MTDRIGTKLTQKGDGPPKLSYWHVWVDDDGITHQTLCELSAFKEESVGGRAPTQGIEKLQTANANVVFFFFPVGWVGDWHPNPKPQWLVPLSGCWFVETMDGMRVEMGPGEISFGGDQATKPDAQDLFGHRSGTVGNEPAVVMGVQLEGDEWIGLKPGFFK